MKWNIKRITGVISFICALGWLCFATYIIYNVVKDLAIDKSTIFALFSMFCTGISTIVYVILTKGVIIELKESDKIKSENQILKLQIEQKELKKKLTME